MAQAALPVQATHIGGPTLLLDIGGLRLLTDPTFDPAGTQYTSRPAPRTKFSDPALSVSQIGDVDAVLLSHDQHFDNLDRAGQAYLSQVEQVFTTPASALSLGDHAHGMETWETVSLSTPGGQQITITAMPARHGPEAAKALTGDVTGWMLAWEGQQHGTLYISGDTVFYADIEEIGRRYTVGTAFLHFGASHVDIFGTEPLSLTAETGIQCAKLFSQATIIPLHYEGWSHLTQGRSEIEQAFAANSLTQRLRFLPFGQPVTLEI